ncbi:peroxiredoxin [Ostreiculturibacter nitratireducens]|uniref:peroxiredoxin n=1 Tax=Ostreiculturibacter nitratireducens TaxID=3075226 RepID=UPI0031B5A80D
MTISEGKGLPRATLLEMGENGPRPVDLAERLKGRKVVLFGLPGAFTRTCSSAHVPSFIRTKPEFDKKGVDEIICVSVNDPFVMKAWGEISGATEAGITMLADPEAEFATAIDMVFSNPADGLINRMKRFALYAEDGVVKVLHVEVGRGVCELSGGESMLAAI